MRVAMIVTGALLALMALAAGLYRFVDLKTDPAAETVAMAALADIKAGDGVALRTRMTPEQSAAITPDKVATLRAYVPKAPVAKRKLVNFTHTYGARRGLTLTYELSYPDQAMLYSLRLVSDGGAWRIEGFNLQTAAAAQLATNRFTLAKPPAQLLFLGLTILSALTMLTAFVSVLCAPRFKRKWLWAILSLIGVCTFTLNWTTGEVDIQPFMLNLVGAGVMRMGYLGFFPWMLKFTLPVGALAAHWRAAKARRETKIAPSVTGTAAA